MKLFLKHKSTSRCFKMCGPQCPLLCACCRCSTRKKLMKKAVSVQLWSFWIWLQREGCSINLSASSTTAAAHDTRHIIHACLPETTAGCTEDRTRVRSPAESPRPVYESSSGRCNIYLNLDWIYPCLTSEHVMYVREHVCKCPNYVLRLISTNRCFALTCDRINWWPSASMPPWLSYLRQVAERHVAALTNVLC